MSAKGRAIAQSLGGFGQSIQNLGETIYKIDAENEATKIQLDIAAKVEAFQQSLLTDDDPGTPGSQTPEGYMAKWEKFTQDLQKQASLAKNPLARQEVTNYIGKIVPSQGTNVAKLQLAAWSEKQKIDRRRSVLSFSKTADPQKALEFAETQYGFLLAKQGISAAEYTNLMREAAAPILEQALYNNAVEAFKKNGESGAYEAISSQLIYQTENDTFTVSDEIRDTVKRRVSEHIQSEYTKERNRLGTLQSNTYAKAMGKTRLDAEGKELPILTLDEIDSSKLPENEKEARRNWLLGMNKEIVDREYTDAEGDLWDAFDILHSVNKGEAVDDEKKKKALSATMIAKLNLPSGRRSFWTQLLQSEEQVAKNNQIEVQRKEVGAAFSALRRSAYSQDGTTSTPEDAALIGKLNDQWLDSFALLPGAELNGYKDELARLTSMRTERQTRSASTKAENDAYDAFGKLTSAASGQAGVEVPKPEDVAALIAKIDPARQGAFKQEAAQLYATIAKVQNEETNNSVFWNFVSKADLYRTSGSGISKTEIETAVKAKSLTASQGKYLLDEMATADQIKNAEATKKEANQKSLARYDAATRAYDNLKAQAAGQELKKGSNVLSKDYLRTLGMDENERQYWEGVLERFEQNQLQDKEISDKLAQAKAKGKTALAQYNTASQAYQNLKKKNRGEELPEGAPVLSTEYIRAVGFEDAGDVQYWDSVLERFEANKQAEDELKEKLATVKQAAQDELNRYDKASVAYQNLLKQNRGEKLEEGAPILDGKYIRTLGLNANELQYWDQVIEKVAANKKQLDAIQGQGSREKTLVQALSKTYAAIRTGKWNEKETYLTPALVEETFKDVDDPDGYKSWVAISEQMETAKQKKTEETNEEAWRQKMWKAEAVSEKKARGEDIGTEKELDDDLIKSAPATIKEEEKAYYSRRKTAIADTASRFDKQKAEDEFIRLIGNTKRVTAGELPKGTPILTFDAIWENKFISSEMKMSADTFLRQSIGGVKSGPSDADQKIALDQIEAGAKILKRIKEGDTRNTTWTYTKDGKSYTIDLAKGGTEAWDKITREMSPYLAGHLADIEDYRGYFTGQKVENPKYKLADETIAAYEKRTKTTLSPAVKQNLRNWAYSKADQNPSMDTGKLVELFENGIGAKEVGFNFKAGLDLNLTVRNSAEDYVEWLSNGEGVRYMGLTPEGLPKPAHPAVLEEMERFSGKFREAMNIVPGWKGITIGPKGQALEAWMADGQRVIVISKDQAGSKAGEIFKALGFTGNTEEVTKLEFYLGNVDGQAHIIKRTTTKSGTAYEQALFERKWESLYTTDRPYVYETSAWRNNPDKNTVPKPGETGFIAPNSYYPGTY